jgi:isopropylmalate/homocitrate/citramalate synthase
MTGALVFAATSGFAQAAVPKTAQPAQPQKSSEAEALEQEFREVSTKIQEAEMQAMESDKVAKKKEAFDRTLEEKMIEENPDLEEPIEQRRELRKTIQAYQEGKGDVQGEDIQEIYNEYNALRRKIMPVEQQVMQKPEVQEDYQEFRQTLLGKMKEINPDISTLLSRQQEIREEYRKRMQ